MGAPPHPPAPACARTFPGPRAARRGTAAAAPSPPGGAPREGSRLGGRLIAAGSAMEKSLYFPISYQTKEIP